VALTRAFDAASQQSSRVWPNGCIHARRYDWRPWGPSHARLRLWLVEGISRSLCVDFQCAKSPSVDVTKSLRQEPPHAMDMTKEEGTRIDPDQDLRSVLFGSLCVPQARSRKLGNVSGSTVDHRFDQIKICKPQRAGNGICPEQPLFLTRRFSASFRTGHAYGTSASSLETQTPPVGDCELARQRWSL
jgi:hypothetical protein